MERTRSTTTTHNGITWYYEQQGSGPHVVLIPDGIGDCGTFDKSIDLIAGQGYTVTTFDNPGMSRSAEAPAEAYQRVTAPKLADQVMSLMNKLGIQTATFWGSSSGGATVLAIASLYPDRVRNGLVHEVPTGEQEFFVALMQEPDDEVIAKTVADAFAGQFPSDVQAWQGLGTEFHARLWLNYPRWVKGYGATLTPSIPTVPIGAGKSDDQEEQEEQGDQNQNQQTRAATPPLDWSIGAATPTAMFLDNVVTAVKAGIAVVALPGTHFPYISNPRAFSDYVVEKSNVYIQA